LKSIIIVAIKHIHAPAYTFQGLLGTNSHSCMPHPLFNGNPAVKHRTCDTIKQFSGHPVIQSSDPVHNPVQQLDMIVSVALRQARHLFLLQWTYSNLHLLGILPLCYLHLQFTLTQQQNKVISLLRLNQASTMHLL